MKRLDIQDGGCQVSSKEYEDPGLKVKLGYSSNYDWIIYKNNWLRSRVLI